MGYAMNKVIDKAEMEAAFKQAAEAVRSGVRGEQSGRSRPVGDVTLLRQKLGLSRADFSARYRVPLETLTSWERGTTRLDAVAQALLALIAADPVRAAEALADCPSSVAAE